MLLEGEVLAEGRREGGTDGGQGLAWSLSQPRLAVISVQICGCGEVADWNLTIVDVASPPLHRASRLTTAFRPLLTTPDTSQHYTRISCNLTGI